jgi:hypothetical protein
MDCRLFYTVDQVQSSESTSRLLLFIAESIDNLGAMITVGGEAKNRLNRLRRLAETKARK